MQIRRIYALLIEPKSTNPNHQNQELVLNWLLVGTFLLILVAFFNTLIDWSLSHRDYLQDRLLPLGVVLIVSAILLGLSRFGRGHKVPPLMLITLFFTIALSIVYAWGVINPQGILLFSLVIVMSSILLGAKSSIYVALLASCCLGVLEFVEAHNYHHPNLRWEAEPSRLSDLIGFSAIFGVLALTTWLFSMQVEKAISRAVKSEKALTKQRDMLEITVNQRTQALQAAQLDQVQQVYRFAELGHLSTALFHDLANHIMSVSLDIEGLKNNQRSDIIQRIQTNVAHIEEAVRRVQQQIKGQAKPVRFNLADEIKAVIKILAFFGDKQAVVIDFQPAVQNVYLVGNLTGFRQIIINLVSNAIESYPPVANNLSRRVNISLSKQSSNATITVTDFGSIISPRVKPKMFEPFFTTKNDGMGVGLYIVKRVIENDFSGSLRVNSNSVEGTSFVVDLPLKPKS